MSNFPIYERDHLSSEQRRFWDLVTTGPRSFATGGPDANSLPGLYNSWLPFPQFGELMVGLGDAIRQQENIPGKLREMVIITTSVLLNSRLEYDVHSQFARLEGLSDTIIAAIGEGTEPPFEDDSERVIYTANVELVRTSTLSAKTQDEVIKLFGLPGLVQLIALVGLYSIVSYTINSAGVELPENFKLDPEQLQKFLDRSRS